MNAERYTEFLERSGIRVRHAAGIGWVESSRGIWMSFPYHLDFDPAVVASDPPLRSTDIAARWPCPPGLGRPSYRLVCRGADYGFGRLEPKARNQTRRGLERCRVERADPKDMLQDAEELERDTRARQGRQGGTRVAWQRLLSAASVVQGAEVWTARIEGRIGAFLLGFRMDRWLHVTHVRSRRALLGSYPNNALLFEANRQSLTEGGLDAISIGFEAIQGEVDGLDHFKIAMGYLREPVDCRILQAPLGRALTAIARLPWGSSMLKRLHGSEAAAKAVGLARWVTEQGRDAGNESLKA